MHRSQMRSLLFVSAGRYGVNNSFFRQENEHVGCYSYLFVLLSQTFYAIFLDAVFLGTRLIMCAADEVSLKHLAAGVARKEVS